HDRGLRPPLLVISDGAGGLINAAETVLARSLRQRCLIHRARNVLAKVPTSAQAELKAAYWQIFQTDDLDADPGQQLVDAVQTRIDAFARRYGPRHPAAVRCLLADRAQLTTYLRFPTEHHHRIPPPQLNRGGLRRDPQTGEGDRPAARRGQLPVAGLGGAGPRLAWLAGRHPDPDRRAPAARSAPPTVQPVRTQGGGRRSCRCCRIASVTGAHVRPLFHRQRDATKEEDPEGYQHDPRLLGLYNNAMQTLQGDYRKGLDELRRDYKSISRDLLLGERIPERLKRPSAS